MTQPKRELDKYVFSNETTVHLAAENWHPVKQNML